MPSKPRIEIHEAKNKEFFLTLKSANNKKVMTSGETYKTLQGVKNAAATAKALVKGSVVVNKTKKEI